MLAIAEERHCLLWPQVGEYDIVIEVGQRVLDTWESRQFRRDVLLSMALAHCGLASDDFEKQAVASGCGLLVPLSAQDPNPSARGKPCRYASSSTQPRHSLVTSFHTLRAINT